MNRWFLEKLVEFIRVARRIETVTTSLKANCNTMLRILYTPQHDPVEASLSWISQPKVRLDILILSFQCDERIFHYHTQSIIPEKPTKRFHMKMT
jgi:hypothetical protein